MGRGGSPYLSYTAFVLLSAISYTDASDLWQVDIDNGPAPSPEDGPPFSAHATRDRSLLPFQIIGVVGAYIAVVLILGTALLTFGKRLRKRALSATERPTEMIRPLAMLLSGQSPARARLGPFSRLHRQSSQASSMRSKLSSAVASPMDSTVNFDWDVIQKDKLKNQEALASVYSAIYEAEDRKSAISVATTERRIPALSMPQHPRRGPPHLLVYSGGAFNRYDTQPTSPRTPTSPVVRAIYPPLPGLSNYEAPQSPIRTRKSRGSLDFRHAPPSDHVNSSSSPSQNLRGKLARDKIRKTLKISAPLRDDNSDGARTPLSPRFYTDPGAPPKPPSARTRDTQWQERIPESADHRGHLGLESARQAPLSHPQRPSHLPLSPSRSPRANGTGALPFRQFTSQQRSDNSNRTTPITTWNSARPISPTLASPAIRHYEIELDAQKLRGGGGGGGDFLSPSGMHGQKTPYSASFMNTMITPVTPHFTTRAERLQQRRELHGAIMEEDRVVDEGEMWRDAY